MRTTTAALAFLICASPGVVAQEAYLDKLSAAPGETVRVHSGFNFGPISVWR